MNMVARACRLAHRIRVLIRPIVANRTGVALTLAALSLGGRTLLLPWIPIPRPAIQDEFSYLLAGDTFASGRLTNPQHPLWIHFETVHEIVRPSYQSKYPPLQGMILAFGQAVLGNPWLGVWLSMGALSAALYWALAGWLPPRWALLGGLLALTRVGLVSHWSEGYWGGSAAAAAGALVIGAVPRLRSNPRTGIALTLGVGLVLLANCRPYEGLVLGAACLAAVLMKVHPAKILKPLAVIFVPAALWMSYYNYRVTGNPLVLPYQLHEQQYSTSSQFAWDTEFHPPPHYNHEALRAEWVDWAQVQRTYEHAHPWGIRIHDAISLARFFLRLPMTWCVLLFLIPMVLYQPKLRLVLVLLVVFIAGLELETTLLPHYAAPGIALVYILAAAALRRFCHQFPAWIAVPVIGFIFYFNCLGLMAPQNRWLYDKRDFIARRESVLAKLNQCTGNLLVLVKYGPGHDINHEWVYNRANIDRSQIVWAREMGPDQDQELVRYYPDRTVWRLVEDRDGFALSQLRRPE